MPRLDVLLTGYDIPDEIIERTSSTALALGHDTIRGTADLEIWTGAGGTGTQLALTTDYTVSDEDTDLSTESGVSIYTKLAIVNGTYHNVDLYVTYKTIGDYSSVLSTIKATGIFTGLENSGLPYSLDDDYAFDKYMISRRHAVGDLVSNEMGNAPVAYANSQSSTNPSNPEYNPCIPRGDGDHDISTTQTTQAAIDKFRMAPLTVGGYSSYAVTVSGSTITVSGPSNTVRDALLNSLQNCGFVNRWKSSGESATYADSGPDWTYASRIYCVTIDGVDYPITAVSVGSSTITVTGTPASGAQTLYVYPMRIAGSTTSARLRSLAGFVPVPSGDGSMTIMAMAQLMDTTQDHLHNGNGTYFSVQAGVSYTGWTSNAGGGEIATEGMSEASKGEPRASKNTSPRTIGVELSTWLGALFATNWTTA